MTQVSLGNPADLDHPPSLKPGATIGILGGGQLGRMIALAAAPLGFRTHILTPEVDSPAAQVACAATVADYEDPQALADFAAAVDAVTIEFENIPTETVSFLAERVPVRPSARALGLCQDRLAEKVFINTQGVATAAFRAVPDPSILPPMLAEIGTPAMLKANRFGYDGKGQARLEGRGDSAQAWEKVGGRFAILEAHVDFVRELSVIAARDRFGGVVCYPPVENRHQNHILKQTIAPAPLPPQTMATAVSIAERLATALEITGLLAVEMFETRDGEILVNELAPRPHNSGHWTIEGCRVSQFAQLVRVAAGLPVAPIDPIRPMKMVNLLGDEVDQWSSWLADPAASVHLYGKGEARPGRKMGHVTVSLATSPDAPEE